VADLRRKILEWYDGCNFRGEKRLLNPISVLNFFPQKEFSGYWIGTGPPSFLKSLIARNPYGFIFDSQKEYSDNDLKEIELSSPEPIPVLFQTGYLTIDSETFSDTSGTKYSFKVPNLEVANSLGVVLLTNVFGFDKEERELMAGRLKAAIKNRDAEELETIFGTVLRKISHHQHSPKEYFYHAVIRMFIFTLGIDVRPETSSGIGRSDIDVVLPGGIYAAIEVKYRAQSKAAKEGSVEEEERLLSEAAKEALTQCLDRGYSHQYRLEAREIVNIGLGVYHRVGVKVLLEMPEPAGKKMA
jgi:hypothetical protein